MADDDDELEGDYLPVGLPYPLPPPRANPPALRLQECTMFLYSDGSAYAGDWVRGMRSGWGVYNAADGCQYLGVRTPL